MNKTELAQQLTAKGPVKRTDEAEAVLDAVATIISHALEQGEPVDWPELARFRVVDTGRERGTVAIEPSSELRVAGMRHAGASTL